MCGTCRCLHTTSVSSPLICRLTGLVLFREAYSLTANTAAVPGSRMSGYKRLDAVIESVQEEQQQERTGEWGGEGRGAVCGGGGGKREGGGGG